MVDDKREHLQKQVKKRLDQIIDSLLESDEPLVNDHDFKWIKQSNKVLALTSKRDKPSFILWTLTTIAIVIFVFVLNGIKMEDLEISGSFKTRSVSLSISESNDLMENYNWIRAETVHTSDFTSMDFTSDSGAYSEKHGALSLTNGLIDIQKLWIAANAGLGIKVNSETNNELIFNHQGARVQIEIVKKPQSVHITKANDQYYTPFVEGQISAAMRFTPDLLESSQAYLSFDSKQKWQLHDIRVKDLHFKTIGVHGKKIVRGMDLIDGEISFKNFSEMRKYTLNPNNYIEFKDADLMVDIRKEKDYIKVKINGTVKQISEFHEQEKGFNVLNPSFLDHLTTNQSLGMIFSAVTWLLFTIWTLKSNFF